MTLFWIAIGVVAVFCAVMAILSMPYRGPTGGTGPF